MLRLSPVDGKCENVKKLMIIFCFFFRTKTDKTYSKLVYTSTKLHLPEEIPFPGGEYLRPMGSSLLPGGEIRLCEESIRLGDNLLGPRSIILPAGSLCSSCLLPGSLDVGENPRLFS